MKLAQFFSNFKNLIATIGFWDVVDILVVAVIIYLVLVFVRRNNSHNVVRGIVILLAVFALANLLNLKMVTFLLQRTLELGLLALVIIFQPELRRLLERMGSGIGRSRYTFGSVVDMAVAQTALACKDMAESRTGALIIFERSINLNDIINTGTMINSDVTAELIKNLFYDKAPLHDGAIIIRDGRIIAAGCVLPLTKSTNLSKDLGMRHRAGIGLSEQSDAIVVIVSEEAGAVSIAMNGTLKRHLDNETFEKILRNELVSDEKAEDNSITAVLKKIFKPKKKEQSDEEVF
ncbi:MAG: diadenylate cyclase CdaA [Oscillospiraceae bacterium]|jgi:diadenylate cyclase|nr:diadenylate cyclase CdaA [Oscillospiraceae bacterium]